MRVESWEVAVTLAATAFGSGGFVALFRTPSRNRLDDANSAVALAGAYAKLIDQLEHRIKMLEVENTELRSRVLDLEERMNGRKGSA